MLYEWGKERQGFWPTPGTNDAPVVWVVELAAGSVRRVFWPTPGLMTHQRRIGGRACAWLGAEGLLLHTSAEVLLVHQ